LADILKMYPMRGWQIVLGELLAPTAILTGIQWFLLIIGTVLLSQSHEFMELSLILGIAFGAALILPILDLLILQIPNGAVLLFPAWFQTSRTGAHGIEATGQRLISIFGQVLALIVALIPTAGVFTGFFFLLRMFNLDLGLVIPLASLVAAFFLAHAGHLDGRSLITLEGRAGYKLMGSSQLAGRLTLQLPASFRIAAAGAMDPARTGVQDPSARHLSVTLEWAVPSRGGGNSDGTCYVGFRSGANHSFASVRQENLLVAGISKSW